MQKEQLLNLLGPQAREAFERAKQLALAKGGVLTPLHLLASLLEGSPAPEQSERAQLINAARSALAALYPAPAQSITVTKDTQSVIAEAGRLAQMEGARFATPAHLLRATLIDPVVKEAIGDAAKIERLAAELILQRAEQPAHSGEAQSGENQSGESKAGEARAFNSAAQSSSPQAAQPAIAPPRQLTGALKDYCADLAEESRASSAHPFIGREREITAVLETLCRKLKNNPLLIGKPGVGKSAIVAAVASRLCEQSVPARIRGKRILEVSRIRLLADAKFAGEIEERLKTLLEDVRREGDVILFFDEIHTLFSAGGAGGTGDVANLLKSSLSKGEMTCIGATTLAEYYKYIARDEALARRFSTMIIEEPSAEETKRILSESRSAFEAYHSVKIEDEIIALIVEMAERYLHSRSFPDKAFDLLDKAAAKATIAGEDRVSRECVTETLSETTGLPLEIMDEDPAERLERLETFLNSAVPGQQRASRDVARVVRIAKLGLELRPEQPDGVFLFIGPEGVGKREMAAGLAKFLYGSSQKMIEFDMSQFAEHWSMSRLIGAEPGYVGYSDRSGLLSKAAEDNPHSVLYFRNVDLAHAVIQQFLGEAFEQGRFTDATGASVSLSNTTVVMSLSQMIEGNKHGQVGFVAHSEDGEENRANSRERGAGFGLSEGLQATIDEVVEFLVLDRAAMEKIIGERLDALKSRLESAQSVTVKLDEQLPSYFAEQLASERKSLAQVERLLQETIIIPFTKLHIDRRVAGARPEVRIHVEGNSIRVDSGV